MMSFRSQHLASLPGLATLLLLLTGCGGSKKDASGDGGGKGRSETKYSTGSAGVELPKDFDKDIPIYPGAKVDVVTARPVMTAVILLSKDTPQQVREYYAKELAANEWTINTAMETEKGGTFITKKDQRACNIAISIKRKTGETTIHITRQQIPERP